MPIYSGFYKGFHCRHEWNEGKTDIVKKETEDGGEAWITLFIDLVYVAMFMKVGFLMEYCGESAEVIAYAFAVFVIMFNSRWTIDTYSNRFFADDIFHRLVYYIYTFGVFLMTLNINYTTKAHRRLDAIGHNAIGDCPHVSEYWEGFAYGFFITRFSLLALYSMICYQNKQALQQFGILIVGFSCSTLILSGSILTGDGTQQIYYAALFIEFFVMVLPNVLSILQELNIKVLPEISELYPMDMFEAQNRLGIFFMMTLGEAMIQLLQRVYSTDEMRDTYAFNSFTFMLVFSFGMQYFDAVHRRKGVKHAMTRSKLSNVLFVWAHPVLAFFNLYMTVGTTVMYIAVEDGTNASAYYRRMLSFGAFAQCILMVFMRLLHKGFRQAWQSPSRIFYIAVRLSIAFAHFSLRYYHGTDTSAVTLQALLAFGNNVLDIVVAMKPVIKRTVRESFSTELPSVDANFSGTNPVYLNNIS